MSRHGAARALGGVGNRVPRRGVGASARTDPSARECKPAAKATSPPPTMAAPMLTAESRLEAMVPQPIRFPAE